MWVWKKINVQPVIIVSFLLLPNVNMINSKILNQSITVLTRFCSMNFINDRKTYVFHFMCYLWCLTCRLNIALVQYLMNTLTEALCFLNEGRDVTTCFQKWIQLQKLEEWSGGFDKHILIHVYSLYGLFEAPSADVVTALSLHVRLINTEDRLNEKMYEKPHQHLL